MRHPPRPNLLLLEGKTDALVANHLAASFGVPDYYDDVAYSGISDLLRALPRRLRESERRRIAVVLDSNADPGRRWRELCGRLNELGYSTPCVPDRAGSVVEAPGDSLPRVGIWLMPDNGSPGILEDFVQKLIRPGDDLLPLAGEAVKGIPADRRRFSSSHVSKAEVYTWLAWQKEPGSSFGPAIKAGLLDAGQPAARAFVDWVRRVFE